jgi:hypothetical protein
LHKGCCTFSNFTRCIAHPESVKHHCHASKHSLDFGCNYGFEHYMHYGLRLLFREWYL